MDENELRAALRTTVALHPEPPPMQSQTAVAAGRRAARRRNLLAGGGAAAAILAVTLAAIPGQSYFRNGGTDIQAAADPSAPAPPARTSRPLPQASAPSGVPSGEETKPAWPPENGGDATADSGAHHDTGKALLADLLTVVPDGYTAPAGSVADGIELQSHQAALDGEHWSYMSTIVLRKGGHSGGLIVEVHEPGNGLPTDVCDVATAFWGRGGSCLEQTIGGARVGVVAGPTEAWAAYRHSDGTVVYVMQSRATTYGDEAGFTPLPELPFSNADLAELATSERFR